MNSQLCPNPRRHFDGQVKMLQTEVCSKIHAGESLYGKVLPDTPDNFDIRIFDMDFLNIRVNMTRLGQMGPTRDR